MSGRIFLLSPASCRGERARLVLSERAAFPLARQLRTTGGAPLGDVMTFLSGLYFRGKLTYARVFAWPPRGRVPAWAGTLVITPDAGLRPADAPVTLADLRAAAAVDIDAANPRYLAPLEATARVLAEAAGPRCEVVLLGSVASEKYVGVLGPIFGPRLRFPAEFVGRGDMSRGGLLLRCVREERELAYVPVAGATRRGPRPPRLGPPALARRAGA